MIKLTMMMMMRMAVTVGSISEIEITDLAIIQNQSQEQLERIDHQQ